MSSEKKFKINSKVLFMIFAIVIGLLVGSIVLLISGYNPVETYSLLITGIFQKPKNIAWTIVNATPLIFTGLSFAFALKTGLFNIGAEGQYIVGTIVAFLVGFLVDLPPIIHIPLILISAVIAGAIYGGISGFIKAKFGMSEVISTIMLNWIAFYMNNFIVNMKAFKKPNSMGTFDILESGKITFFKDGVKNMSPFFMNFFAAPVHFGIILAIISSIVIWFILKKTTLGYKLKSVGYNPYASEYAGINVNAKLTQAMAISGILAALGGACQLLGYSYSLTSLSAMQNFGFNGMAVSLLAYNNPIGCIVSALFFGGLNYTSGNVQRVTGAPSELIQIIIGTIVLFTAIPYVFKIIKAKIAKKRSIKNV
ncbi:MAG: ABC transporter permease [Peptoniphilaceae bacterium]|nr:ABC transporter permease [Peptoniphilaceae bacterium]MDD7383099.1 ABC transporter permease [Peptoniphilaceae bacterium]MDY3737534.1 ABC transporter permease [Peptoniphilaceae bacterium]